MPTCSRFWRYSACSLAVPFPMKYLSIIIGEQTVKPSSDVAEGEGGGGGGGGNCPLALT